MPLMVLMLVVVWAQRTGNRSMMLLMLLMRMAVSTQSRVNMLMMILMLLMVLVVRAQRIGNSYGSNNTHVVLRYGYWWYWSILVLVFRHIFFKCPY